MTAPVDPPGPAAAGDPSEAAVAESASARQRGRRAGALGVWCVLTGLAVALDGVTGAVVGVLVAAVLLARLSPRLLGGLGVASLVGVPLEVMARGVPKPADVSPFFVAGSLWPHHLMFAGLALVGSGAVLDLIGDLRAQHEETLGLGGAPHRERLDPPEPIRRLSARGRYAIVVAVAIVSFIAALAAWFA